MAIYLDHCASTPVDERVLNTMVDVYRNHYGNADSRTHFFGMQAKEIVSKSRRVIADILSVDPTEVIFTSGATESDNMAILGLAAYGEKSGKRHIITTAIEHKAGLEAAHHMEQLGFTVDYVMPDSYGRIQADDILRRVREDTLLVSVMHVNNETGTIQPVEQIGAELDTHDVFFHVDAAQSFGKLNESLRHLKYDMLSLSGHKIYGPQGIGALILKRKQYKKPPVQPLLFGGQQEHGLRPGTTPVALVAGLAKAAEIMESEYINMIGCLKHQKEAFLSALSPFTYYINSDPKHSLPNILNISIGGIDAEALFTALKDDYSMSNGSACTSGSYSPSHVLQAMGLSEERIAQALRISWWNEAIDTTALITYVRSQME